MSDTIAKCAAAAARESGIDMEITVKGGMICINPTAFNKKPEETTQTITEVKPTWHVGYTKEDGTVVDAHYDVCSCLAKGHRRTCRWFGVSDVEHLLDQSDFDVVSFSDRPHFDRERL